MDDDVDTCLCYNDLTQHVCVYDDLTQPISVWMMMLIHVCVYDNLTQPVSVDTCLCVWWPNTTCPCWSPGSRLTSPRPSVVGKNRKRALSHSPISDYLDIQSLTRSSEGSLQLTPFHQHNSRSSSAASGSYGHLSAGNAIAAFAPRPQRWLGKLRPRVRDFVK